MFKSICFIAGGLSAGGQERALTNLANDFATKEYHISIICLFKTEVFFEMHPDITIIWPTEDREKTNKFFYALKLIPYIRKNIIKINPDTIVCFGDWFNAYSILATSFLKTPIFITNRMGPNLYLGKFLEFFNKLTYQKATAMIVQTARAKEIMMNKYGIKSVHIVPNAIKPVEVKNRIHEKSIITVGRLSREKGHVTLIEAFAKMTTNSWRLDIVGDGPKRTSLNKKVIDLGIQDRVFFHGHQKDFKKLLSKASLFVLPSFYEGFPNALVEAMTVPIVCISSDCVAGPSEIISNGVNGFLFEPGNVTELTKILDEVTSDTFKMEQLEQNAYKVREQYDFQVIANKFLATILN